MSNNYFKFRNKLKKCEVIIFERKSLKRFGVLDKLS